MFLSLAKPARGERASEAKRAELAQIQSRLEQTRRQIDEFKKLEQALGGELRNIRSRGEESRRRMEGLQRNLRLAESRKRDLKARLGALGQAEGFWRSELSADLRGYVAALAARTDGFGTSELWVEALRRSAIAEKTRLMSGIEGISRKTRAAEAETGRQAQELLDKSRRAKAEEELRRQEEQRKQAAIAEARRKKAEAIKTEGELAATAKALTKLLRALGQRKGAGPLAAALDLPRHSLRWPADGVVVQPFGRQRNPELDSWVISQGLRLQTKPGAPIVPVRAGRVIFAGPFHSYGKVMILEHGGGFFSVYGELGEFLKAKGAEVRSGEIIARAAASEGSGRVYLELRRGAEALDPLMWLQER